MTVEDDDDFALLLYTRCQPPATLDIDFGGSNSGICLD